MIRLFTTLLALIDGSTPADTAVAAALNLTDHYEAAVEILTVFSIYRYAAILGGDYDIESTEYPPWATTYLSEVRSYPEKILADALRTAHDA